MFKSILLVLLLGIAPGLVYAQKTMHMSKVSFYIWRETPKQYVLDQVRDIDLTLYSADNFFSINNEGTSDIYNSEKPV